MLQLEVKKSCENMCLKVKAKKRALENYYSLIIYQNKNN